MSAAGATAPGRSGAAGRSVRAGLVAATRARRWLLILAAAGALLGAGYFWLRDSSFVEVRTVTVTGVTGADAERIRTALAATGRTMTTLHLDRGKLERATSGFPVVRAIEVRADFPHGLRVHVLEHRPAALLVAGARRVPVAGDGTLLPGLTVRGRLPLVRISGAMPLRSLPAGIPLSAVRIAGAAPAPLRPRLEAIAREQGFGLVVRLADGPRLIFGDGSRIAAKWAAAAAVMADRDAAGAAYVDVRIPGRPAAGGLPVETLTPVAPAEAPAGSPAAAVGPGALAQPAPAAPPPAAAPAPAVPAPAAQGGAPPPAVPQPTAPPGGGGGAAAPNPQP